MLTIREINTLPEHHDDPDWVTTCALIRAYNHELIGTSEWDTDPATDLAAARSDDDHLRRRWFAEIDGAAVGYASLRVNRRDAPECGTVLVYVRPGQRHHGIGQRLRETLQTGVAELGLTRLVTWVTTPVPDGETITPAHGVGAVPADHGGVRMAVRDGYTLCQVERVSRYDFESPLIDPHEALRVARAAAGDTYELIVWAGAAPEDMCEDLARLTERMSRDVPNGGLTATEETWDAERVMKRDREILIGNRFYRAVARHVPSGAIVALSELVRDRSNDEALVDQWDTVVLPGHRGHRLGMLVKAANLIQVREAEATATAVVTWNAEENRHMLSVNEALGFREIMREAAFEKQL